MTGASKQAWCCHQSTRHGAHLLLAARHVARQLTPTILENGEKLVDALETTLYFDSILLTSRTHQQIFFNRHLAEELPSLGYLHEPA
jgi:hypothetical protein